jgi:hypothetical protein
MMEVVSKGGFGMRRASLGVGLLLAACAVSASAEGKVEAVGPFGGAAPEAIKAAVEATGHRVVLSDGSAFGDIWFRKALPGLTDGAFVGVVTLSKPASDFRGQPVPAGTYTMRYQTLPVDGNHMGCAPTSDFLLLVAAADDTDPAAAPAYADFTKRSAKAVNTHHPASFYLSDVSGQAAFPAVGKNAMGHEVFFVKVKGQSAEIPLGLVVVGKSDH